MWTLATHRVRGPGPGYRSGRSSHWDRDQSSSTNPTPKHHKHHTPPTLDKRLSALSSARLVSSAFVRCESRLLCPGFPKRKKTLCGNTLETIIHLLSAIQECRRNHWQGSIGCGQTEKTPCMPDPIPATQSSSTSAGELKQWSETCPQNPSTQRGQKPCATVADTLSPDNIRPFLEKRNTLGSYVGRVLRT